MRDSGPYIDQSARALRLNVVDGPLDDGQFTLLASGRIRAAGVELRAAIIGASHLVELARPGHSPLHEVLACGELRTRPASAARLCAAGVEELGGSFACEASAGWEYRFDSSVECVAHGRVRLAALERRVLEARRNAGEIGLAHTFPAAGLVAKRSAGDDAIAARTVVWAGVDHPRSRVRIETAHCYPNEETIVFSRTTVAGATDGVQA